MSENKKYGYVIIGISLLIAFYMVINENMLIPSGYDLSIDGYVISRTIIILFILSTLSKIGFTLLRNKKDQ